MHDLGDWRHGVMQSGSPTKCLASALFIVSSYKSKQPKFFFSFNFHFNLTEPFWWFSIIGPFKSLQFYSYIVTLAHLIITWGFFVQLTSNGWFIHDSFEALLKIPGRTRFLRVLQICLLRRFLERRQWCLPHTFSYQLRCSSEFNTLHIHTRMHTRWGIISRPRGYCQREGWATRREKANVCILVLLRVCVRPNTSSHEAPHHTNPHLCHQNINPATDIWITCTQI